MKSRKKPNPAKDFQSQRLKYDPQVRKWLQRIEGDPFVRPTDVDETQLAYIYSEVLKRRGDLLEPTPFEKAVVATCPILAAPDTTDLAEDVAYRFRLSQMRDFWQGWQGPLARKGPRPNLAAAKAAMAVLGMGGISAHLDEAHQRLGIDTQLRDVFASLEGSARFDIGSYASVARNLERISEGLPQQAMETNIAMLKELRQIFPNGGIGERLLIDGFAVPAWCRQTGAGDPADARHEMREERLRARTPEASFRSYDHTNKGKVKAPYEKRADGKPVGHGRRWRGYYLVVIADQATGLPLVWTLMGGGHDEVVAIVPLLSDLHRLWPDIGATMIAGDSAWDEKEWCRLCEVDYGIAPIFRHHPSEAKKGWFTLEPGQSRDGSVAAITRLGQMICDAHRGPLDYDSFEVPSRLGLRPGQSNDEGAFRIRGIAPKHNHKTKIRPQPCGKLSLRMSVAWHRLTRYPHHPHGDQQKYAMRQAMLIRLNQIESLGNRLKAGLHLGNAGAARTRILSKDTLEALFSLGCLSMTSLSLADQRIQHGIDQTLAPRNVLPLFEAADDGEELAA